MKPTPGALDPEDVRRLRAEGLGIIAIARRLRRRNDLIVSCLNDLGLNNRVTREWIEEQYVHLRQDIDDIARERGVTEAAIRSHLRRFDIPIRYKSKGHVRNTLLADPDWLRERYVTRKMSMHQIAKEAGASNSSVARRLILFGISRRVQTGVRHQPPGHERSFLYGLRDAVLERDGHACRWPGCGSTERLEINHIVPLREGGLTVYENGITLCRPHHHLTFGKEMEFVPLFRGLISLGPLT